MAAKVTGSPWKQISLTPLTGVLDTRSRPADVPVGGFRLKQNFAVTPEAKLCRAPGFSRAFGDVAIDGVYKNQDLHHQGEIRTPPTMLFESTSSTSQRSLFSGTQSSLFVLDETTGLWTTIASGLGSAGSRWHTAELKDNVLFTNNVDTVLLHVLGSGTTGAPGDLGNFKAKVIIQFAGFILLMNLDDNGTKRSTRIKWCDLNDPTSWTVGALNSVAGVQDLPFGDDILAAAPMLGSIYIYTRRGIWRMSVSDPTSTDTFTFTQVYGEPKNQSACLAYPNTLTSTGTDHYYSGRDGFYHYTPYQAEPDRPDWLHRATGVMFTKADTRFDGKDCDTPVTEYVPANRELWISWPSTGHDTNNLTLVAQTEQKTADIRDTGFTCFVNYRRTPTETDCSEAQDFLGVSNLDWTIKDIGVGFFREVAVLSNSILSEDMPLDNQVYVRTGYNSILRGMVPTGLYDREKTIRSLLLDADVSEQDIPNLVKVRIGTSYGLQDPNDTDEICSVRWFSAGNKPLACADGIRVSEMITKNLRPALGLEWKMYQRARFLYFEITVINADLTPAIGGDACYSRLDFDLLAGIKF